MEKYDLKNDKGAVVTINKCKQCNFINSSEVIVSWNSEELDGQYSVNYFKPKALEDKS